MTETAVENNQVEQQTTSSPEGAGVAAEATPANQNWYGDVGTDMEAFIQNKGWDEPQKAVNAYQNLEKMLGNRNNLLSVPEEGDTDAWGELYTKLGRPEAADKYEFQAPEGMEIDNDLENWFKENAFEAGLSGQQAQNLYNSWNEMQVKMYEQSQADINAQANIEMDQLKREWGQAFDEKNDIASKTGAKFGVNEQEVDALKEVLGAGRTLKLFADIGEGLGEHGYVDGGGNNFTMTPAQAKDQIFNLKNDIQFMEKYLNGDKEAIAKMQNLTKLTIPGR